MQKFTVNISLLQFAGDAKERAKIIAPLLPTLSVCTIAAFTAFTLHLRIIWDRVQPLLILFLLYAALILRQDRRSLFSTVYYTGKSLSTYEQVFYTRLEPRWHLLLVAYAAWIAYGLAFHYGRHAAKDLAVLDNFIVSGSEFIISTFRFLVLLFLSIASLSPKIFPDSAAKPWKVRFGLALYFLLLALPPPKGVPQVLGVATTLMRFFFVLIIFVLCEMWRVVVEHHWFMARLCSDSVSLDTLRAMRKIAADNDPLYTLNVASDEEFVPADVRGMEQMNVSLTMLSLLRSAWLLTAPDNVWASVGTFVLMLAVIYNAKLWSHATRERAKLRFKQEKHRQAKPPKDETKVVKSESPPQKRQDTPIPMEFTTLEKEMTKSAAQKNGHVHTQMKHTQPQKKTLNFLEHTIAADFGSREITEAEALAILGDDSHV